MSKHSHTVPKPDYRASVNRAATEMFGLPYDAMVDLSDNTVGREGAFERCMQDRVPPRMFLRFLGERHHLVAAGDDPALARRVNERTLALECFIDASGRWHRDGKGGAVMHTSQGDVSLAVVTSRGQVGFCATSPDGEKVAMADIGDTVQAYLHGQRARMNTSPEPSSKPMSPGMH